MGDIQFDDGSAEFTPRQPESSSTDLTSKIVAWGLAKDRKQAEMVLIVVAVIAGLGALYFIFFSGGAAPASTSGALPAETEEL